MIVIYRKIAAFAILRLIIIKIITANAAPGINSGLVIMWLIRKKNVNTMSTIGKITSKGYSLKIYSSFSVFEKFYI